MDSPFRSCSGPGSASAGGQEREALRPPVASAEPMTGIRGSAGAPGLSNYSHTAPSTSQILRPPPPYTCMNRQSLTDSQILSPKDPRVAASLAGTGLEEAVRHPGTLPTTGLQPCDCPTSWALGPWRSDLQDTPLHQVGWAEA